MRQFADYSMTEYVYAADGRRLKTCHYTSVPRADKLGVCDTATLTAAETLSVDSTMYYGNFVKENTQLSRYDFDGGYVLAPFTKYYYKYYIKDHLGNNRVVADRNGVKQQQNHFYPYGGPHHFSTDAEYQKYKYNGKEYDTMHGHNEYDYGARSLDPVLGQFTTIDPLCEKYYNISPYAYCGGNPVSRVDVDGRDIWQVSNNGSIVNRVSDLNIDKIQIVNLWMDGYEPVTEKYGREHSVTFPYGTIEEIKEINRNGDEFSVFSIKGDDAGISVFELLANNTGKEFTQAKTGADERGINFITTSLDYKSNPNIDDFFYKNSRNIPILREMIHNHPQGSLIPSGLVDDNRGHKAGTWGDIGNANYYNRYYTNVKYYIYTSPGTYTPYYATEP